MLYTWNLHNKQMLMNWSLHIITVWGLVYYLSHRIVISTFSPREVSAEEKFSVSSPSRLWRWEGLGAGGEGDDRGWDGWMASLTQWMWVWVNSGSWWWTGRPGVLDSWVAKSQTRLSDWTELNPSWLSSVPDSFLPFIPQCTHSQIQSPPFPASAGVQEGWQLGTVLPPGFQLDWPGVNIGRSEERMRETLGYVFLVMVSSGCTPGRGHHLFFFCDTCCIVPF